MNAFPIPPRRTPKSSNIAIASSTERLERSRIRARQPGPAGTGGTQPSVPDLVCFSHLRWDFVFQRPQHLLTRFSRERRVFYVEEPVFGGASVGIEVSRQGHGLHVVRPHLPGPLPEPELHGHLRVLVDRLFAEQGIVLPMLWFYTPMALPFTHHLPARVVVYDCMDELSAFAGAPPAMREREAQLMSWADLVFTGGMSLYEAKRDRHPHVHAFPSSIDQAHFAQARRIASDPDDQAGIARPRVGFFGVIDERFDVALLDGLARARPEWQFVIIGPVVKIDPAILPRHANIHYLGKKDYRELPAYLAGWDVAMLPFARNESTRFISPTKTPEYLSAGRPVVSTPITDVVRPYGEQGLVRIAEDVDGFAAAIAAAMADAADPAWLARVDSFLTGNSWDRTWREMAAKMREAERLRHYQPSPAAKRK